VLLIDDLKTEEQLEIAEQVFQSQGNLQSRSRMGLDQSLQSALDPRGAVLSTGEVDVRSRSSLGRMLIVDVRAGDIDPTVLDKLQRMGDCGQYAAAMAAYIRWLAQRLDEVRGRLAKLTAEIRAEMGNIPGAHPRHPEAVASLAAGYRIYLDFAVEVGAIDAATARRYAEKARKCLVELAQAQAHQQEEARPGRKFLEYVAAALASKRCHLLNSLSDAAPHHYAKACGWHTDGLTPDLKVPVNSKCIGYIDEQAGMTYLFVTESEAYANEYARRLRSSQSFESIGRELMNEKLCRAHAEGKWPRATKARRFGREVKRCYCVPIVNLFGDPGKAV
jgi:hypothetical protein